MRRTYRTHCKPEKKVFARHMRNNPTSSEAELWKHLRGRKLGGWKFIRQSIILGWIADFYCSKAGLVVELDGSMHDFSKNQHRDASIASLGIKTIRIPSAEVFTNLPKVLARIRGALLAGDGTSATVGAPSLRPNHRRGTSAST